MFDRAQRAADGEPGHHGDDDQRDREHDGGDHGSLSGPLVGGVMVQRDDDGPVAGRTRGAYRQDVGAVCPG